jgi:hypothetical protein
MIVQMMKDNGALPMVAWPPCQRRDFFFQLLDQAMLVRGDNIHGVADSVPAVEKQLPVSSALQKKGGPFRDRPNSFEGFRT